MQSGALKGTELKKILVSWDYWKDKAVKRHVTAIAKYKIQKAIFSFNIKHLSSHIFYTMQFLSRIRSKREPQQCGLSQKNEMDGAQGSCRNFLDIDVLQKHREYLI